MDPSAYSDAPVGGWQSSAPKGVRNAPSAVSGKSLPSPGEVMRMNMKMLAAGKDPYAAKQPKKSAPTSAPAASAPAAAAAAAATGGAAGAAGGGGDEEAAGASASKKQKTASYKAQQKSWQSFQKKGTKKKK